MLAVKMRAQLARSTMMRTMKKIVKRRVCRWPDRRSVVSDNDALVSHLDPAYSNTRQELEMNI